MSLLNQIIAGVLGRNPRVYGWPVLAIGLNPGGKSQPVQVDANGKMLLSNGAAIPAGVFIAPNQAWATGAAQLFGNWATGFDLSGIGATSFTADSTPGAQLQALLTAYYDYKGAGATYNFSGNAVANTGNIDTLLTLINNSGIQNSTIDISGGTMAPPSTIGSGTGITVLENQAYPALPEIWTMTIPSAMPDNAGGSTYFSMGFNFGGGPMHYQFDASIPLASSTAGFPYVNIGIADSPTPAQVVAWIVANEQGAWGDGNFTDVDNGDGSFTHTETQDYGGAWTFTDIGGSTPLSTAQANGNTVSHN